MNATSLTPSGEAAASASAGPLKLKHRSAQGLNRLFFAARLNANTDTPYWNVPATGGYVGGTTTGQAMALAYLKLINRDDVQASEAQHWLGEIIGSLMVRSEGVAACRPGDEDSPEYGAWLVERASLQGQQDSFLKTVGLFLWKTAQFENSSLRCFGDEELVLQANRGLARDRPA